MHGFLKFILIGLLLSTSASSSERLLPGPAPPQSPVAIRVPTSDTSFTLTHAYQQTKPYTCGPAALRAALSYWRFAISEDELARRAGTNETGTTMLGLAQAARQLGFNAQGERWNWERLVLQDTPVIAYVGHDHFVVMEKADDSAATYLDPASGLLTTLPKELFQTLWKGEVLVLGPLNK